MADTWLKKKKKTQKQKQKTLSAEPGSLDTVPDQTAPERGGIAAIPKLRMDQTS